MHVTKRTTHVTFLVQTFISCLKSAILVAGGLLIMTGDVLPCFDASSMTLPENGAIVITVPAPLSRASKHGVILGSQVSIGLLGSTSPDS